MQFSSDGGTRADSPRSRRLPSYHRPCAASRLCRRAGLRDRFEAASHFDPYLVNAWGLARAPDGPWLVGATDSDYARFYGPTGIPMGNYLLVNGGPTGITWYGGSGFTISGAGVTMPSRFLFASEGG